MKKLITKLKKELSKIDQKKKNLEIAIEALEKVFQHQFKYVRATHNHTYEECENCGLIINH